MDEEEISSNNASINWDRLIEMFQNRIRFLARKMLRDFPAVKRWEETDDIVQMAVMKLVQAFSRNPDQEIKSMIALSARQIHWTLIDIHRAYYGKHGFARNHHSDGFHNVGKIDSGNSAIGNEVDQASYPDEQIDEWTMFHQAVEQLPADLRECFDCIYYQGLNQSETSDILGIDVRTVRRRMRRAKLAIAETLEIDSFDETD